MTATTIDPSSAAAVGGALAAYLAARDDLRDARIVEPPASLGNGFDSFIYTFRLAGSTDARWSRPLVLRLQRRPEQAVKVRSEADVQAFVATAGYPVPELLAAEDAANPLGLPFMIMERVPGTTMLARVTSNPLRAGHLLARLAGVHADLHRLPYAGWPLQEGDEPIALRKIATIRERIARYRFADLEDGLARLERHAPAVLPEAAVVTHNDFHPLNVMVTPKGRLSVIDWSEAALGDRHHDIARTLTLFSFAYIGASSSIERVLLKAARGYLRSRYFNAYERTFPVDRRRLAYFEALQSLFALVQLREIVADPRPEGPPSDAAARAIRDLPKLIVELHTYVRLRIRAAERALS